VLGSALSSFVTSTGEMHWAYFDATGNLYDLSASPAGSYLKADNITALTGAPPVADANGLTSFVTPSGEHHWAYVGPYSIHNGHLRGGDLYDLSWSPSSGYRPASDLTTLLGGSVAAPGTALASFVLPFGQMHWAYFDVNQHLIDMEMFPAAGSFHSTDTTLFTGSPPAAVGSALQAYGAPGSVLNYLYFDANQHLNRLQWDTSGIHKADDLTAIAGAPLGASGGALTATLTSSGVHRWSYFGNNGDFTDGDLYSLTWSAGTGYSTAGDITSSYRAFKTGPGLAVTSLINSAGVFHWAYFGSNLHLYDIFQDPDVPGSSSRQSQDLTAILQVPPEP